MMNDSAKNRKRHYAGKTLAERHAERYEKLIEAGIEVIGTLGYAGSSVKIICNQAGLTERYFYESFNNREDLLAAVYLASVARINEQTRRAISEYPDNKLQVIVEGFFNQVQSDPRIARILFFEAVERSGRLAELKREVEQDFVVFVKLALQEAGLETNLPKEQETLIIIGLFGAMVNIAMRWVLNDYQESFEDVVQSALIIVKALQMKVFDS